MKISWFSPLPPDHTDIANYTVRLLPALGRAFETTVYTEAKSWDPGIDELCPVKRFTPETLDWKALNTGGIPIYHIGNNIHYHGDIIKVARRCPGIVVLHDLSIHETVLNLCLKRGHGRAEYFDILHRFGGPGAVEMGKAFLDERSISTNTLSDAYPLFEYALRSARGIITHNPLNVETIRAFTAAPVLYAPLPYVRRSEVHPPVDRHDRESRTYKIVLFGFLGSSNRRLRPFLEAFAKSGCTDRFEVTIAGKYPRNEVEKWIRDLSLDRHVKLRGFIPGDELDGLLKASDLCINLRWPSRGEASGSLLRTWNQSLPVIVTSTAFYASLPEDAVAFVNPQREEEEIISHLQAFARDPHPYFKMGLAAREHLVREHSTDAFVGFLEGFIPEVERARGLPYPQTFGKDLARRFIANYPDPLARRSLQDTCAEEISGWA
jgi:glycosyltransferase involved in cell wall biosynthesis